MDIQGLLGNWGKWTGDPDKDSAIQQGLLSTGLSMMAGRGSTGQIIGQAGMNGMNTFGNVMQETKANKLRELEMKRSQQAFVDSQEAAQRRRTLESLPARNMRSPETMDNRDVGMPGERRPTLDMQGLESDYLATPGGFETGLALRNARTKKAEPIKGSAGDMWLDPVTMQPIAAIPPKPDALPAGIQEFEYSKQNPEFNQWDNSRRRAGASNVNVGGKPPAGYSWNAAGDQLIAIPGGPADKLPDKQQGNVIGAQNLQNAIDEYRKHLATFGALDALSPDARARMGTKYVNMMMQAKEAWNLGVLTGNDYELMQEAITDPRSFTGAITSKLALDDQAKELRRIMGDVGRTASNTRPRMGGETQAPPDKTIVRTGTLNGRKVIQYSDGTNAYAD